MIVALMLIFFFMHAEACLEGLVRNEACSTISGRYSVSGES